MRYYLNPWILAILFLPMALIAQNGKNTASEITASDESFFLTDISYINDAVFMGRRDSIAAPYIFPSIGYFDKSGFFANASLSYLTSSDENRVDLFLISAGFVFEWERWQAGISGTAYFYNEDSYNVRSETVGDLSGFLTYDLKIIDLSLLASTFFNNGSSADIFAGLMLDKAIYSNDNSFVIDPTLTIYAGSQYFYEEYYNTSRLGNRKGQGTGTGTSDPLTPTSVEIKEASKFKVLSIEVGLPMQYQHNHFIFSFTPVLALPQSSATITTEEAVFEEDLESTFYFTAGISYWFNSKKAIN
ncbi:hypothetical protein [Lentiprolixibacter aurantiacus]|uniref:Uncharacterized protein n=1 Tax=Lentiprolixibacter aurantiacus TaxID=2993939 RepID=A0AAE3MMC7_9FLAO|nr:hypothetical protein [Lentiprolixibacter aurantiacus]MCX2720093.1 hypothetical protein [Lentiprolixibacter aurantiacus]